MPRDSAHHILTYAKTLAGGGVERVQLRLAADWLAAGRRVTLVLGSRAGPLAAEIPAGIETIELGSPTYAALFALPGHVRGAEPDVIFCPGNYYTGIAAWTRLRLGTHCPPIVAKLSNALRRTDHSATVAAGYRAWLRRHPRFIAAFVAMSPKSRDEAAAMMTCPASRISVIGNPPARHASGGVMPSLPVTRFLLGVGRLEPQKRWDRLIAALPRLADRGVSLVILGEGSARTALEALIAQLGLVDRIALPGHVLDPTAAFARAAVVVLTSDYEGVPGVLREALAQGTPVVSTESSVAVREIVATPDLGSVVPIGDEGALIAALDHWLAPGQPRPTPVPEPGVKAAGQYLALFDRLVAGVTV